MVGKPYVSAFENFFQIENLLNIKEVMNKNMFVYLRHLPQNVVNRKMVARCHLGAPGKCIN